MTLHSRATVAACLLLAALTSQAAIVRLHFSGSINQVDAALTGRFHVGDAASIDLSYDLAAPALPGSRATVAVYDLVEMDLDFGGYEASYHADAAHRTFVAVFDNHPMPWNPTDAFGATDWMPGGGDSVAGLPLQQGFIALYDFTTAAFNSTSLPTTLNLADFQEADAGLQFCTNGGCGVGSQPSAVKAGMDSLTAVPSTLPEPAGLALTLLGLGIAGTARRLRPAAQRTKRPARPPSPRWWAATFVLVAAAANATSLTVYTDRSSFLAALASRGQSADVETYDGRPAGPLANGQSLGAFSYTFDPSVNGAAVAPDGSGGQALGGVPSGVFVGGDSVTLGFQGARPLQAFGADFFYAPSFLPAPASIYRMAVMDGSAAGTTAWNGPSLDPSGGSFFLGFIGDAGTAFRGVRLFSVVPTGDDGVPLFLDAAYQVDNLIYAATSPVPEPASALALTLGVAMLAWHRRPRPQAEPPTRDHWNLESAS